MIHSTEPVNTESSEPLPCDPTVDSECVAPPLECNPEVDSECSSESSTNPNPPVCAESEGCTGESEFVTSIGEPFVIDQPASVTPSVGGSVMLVVSVLAAALGGCG